MKSLEKKLFEKLAKKGWFTLAKIVCRFQLFSKKHLSEKQFDQYLTTLGPREVTLKLSYPKIVITHTTDQIEVVGLLIMLFY